MNLGPRAQQQETLLALTRVIAQVSISRPSIYEEMAAGTFPRPVNRGPKALWVESEINAWVAKVIQQGRPSAHKSAEVHRNLLSGVPMVAEKTKGLAAPRG